jgi:hypothetical protein
VQAYPSGANGYKWRDLAASLGRIGLSRRDIGSLAPGAECSSGEVSGSGISDWVRSRVVRLDERLSCRLGVRSFSADPQCLFRAALARAPHALHLPSGILPAQDSQIIELHLWNEHIPPLPASGPNLVWGRELYARLDRSMSLLADAVRNDPHYRGVVACRARTNFAGPGCPTESITRLIERCGFHDVDEGSPTIGMRIHDACENLLIAALVWAHNPHALCRRKFRRVRRPVWISREYLLTRYPAR